MIGKKRNKTFCFRFIFDFKLNKKKERKKKLNNLNKN